MGYNYAIIDNQGYIVGTRWDRNQLSEPNYILVEADFDPYGKRYVNGEWVEYTPEPDPMENALTEDQEAMLEMQANIEYLVELIEGGLA